MKNIILLITFIVGLSWTEGQQNMELRQQMCRLPKERQDQIKNCDLGIQGKVSLNSFNHKIKLVNSFNYFSFN